MNPQWNTPPNGDFASYVERLSAQALLPKREHQEGEHGLDIGMTPSGEPHGAAPDAAAAARRRMQSNGESQSAPANAGQMANGLLKGIVIAWIVAMAALLIAGLPFIVVLAVFVGGLWLANKFRRLAFPPGVENWKQWAEQAARKQRELQKRGPPK
jgi:hypothetical protein